MSLFVRKTSISSCGLLKGRTDWHCHILPGVDDGFRTMDESLHVLETYARAGISEVWLTPHVMEDIPNTTARLREVFAELRSAYSGPVKLNLASENMMDSLFEERLAARDVLPICGDHLLVETSYFNPPMDLHGILSRVRSAGFFPILAHPERYMYMPDDEYDRLKAEGTLFQLNISSLVGSYGEQVRHKSERLLKKGMYDYIGTDLHRESAFSKICDSSFPKNILKSTNLLTL